MHLDIVHIVCDDSVDNVGVSSADATSTDFFSVLGQSCECDGNGVMASVSMDGFCNISEAEYAYESTSGAGKITGGFQVWGEDRHDRHIIMCGKG